MPTPLATLDQRGTALDFFAAVLWNYTESHLQADIRTVFPPRCPQHFRPRQIVDPRPLRVFDALLRRVRVRVINYTSLYVRGGLSHSIKYLRRIRALVRATRRG